MRKGCEECRKLDDYQELTKCDCIMCMCVCDRRKAELSWQLSRSSDLLSSY